MKYSLPILRHVPHESAGMLEIVLAEMDLEYHYVDLFQQTTDRLNLSTAPGLVVLGGPMNVDEVEKYPHLAWEVGWIKQALVAGLPILGICLGAQLLAKDTLFEGCGKRITVFHWHGDTFDLPQNTVRLAQSELCRNQGFRYGPLAYGIQFHIEMTEKMVDMWVAQSAANKEFVGMDVDLEAIREKTLTELPILEALADKILGRFVRLCFDKIRKLANRRCLPAN
jgi:GMP synthase (glutamine-hydrolysing)